MKNLIVVLVVLALLGGGYFYLSSRGMLPKAPAGTTTTGGSDNVFTSIKDALSKSLSLKCVYKDEQGVETTSYIKAGAVRVMMTGLADDKQPNNIIMKDKKMHMWSDTSKTGFVFTVEEPNVTPDKRAVRPTPGGEGSKEQESILAQIEKYKNACKPEVIADSMFAVPGDVNFQDMDALQKQMMQQAPQAPGNAGVNQDYINQMMQQYGQGQ